jgi:hypothetical protein
VTAQESTIREILDDLVRECRRLRARSEGAASLEANRLALAYWQDALARCQSSRDPGYTGDRPRM